MFAHVSLAFATLPDSELDNFVQTILDTLYPSALFPTPPVTSVVLLAAKDDFTTKLSAASTGGQADTAAKNTSRQTLLGLLRQLAGYVDGVAQGNVETILASSFKHGSLERRQEPLLKPLELVIKNGGLGVLIARIKAVKNTRMYEGRASADGGVTWLPSVFSGDSLHIIFSGLTPGVEYTIQIRALGGSTGQSDWSDSSTHRSL